MALALDTHDFSPASANLNVTAVTKSYTMGVVSNGIILVGVAAFDPVVGTRTVSSVTYNGVTLTVVPGATVDNSANFRNQIYYGLAPASGAHNVVVNMGGNCDGVNVFIASFSGAKQSGQPDASAVANVNAATTAGPALTTIAANCAIFTVAQATNGPLVVAGSQTELDPNSAGRDAVDAYRLVTTAGAYTPSYTRAAADDIAVSAVSIAPFVASAANTGAGFFMLV